MSRIYSSLAMVAVCLLLISVGFGLRIGQVGSYNRRFGDRVLAEQRLKQLSTAGQREEATELRRQIDIADPDFRRNVKRATWHMLAGILAGIVAILVNSISVTYFIGTSRWCKEVAETYSLNPDHVAKSRRYKRKSFPWAFLGIVTVLVIVALGGASDPGTGIESTANWALPHFIVALLGVVCITYSFVRQAGYIRLNSDLVELMLSEVRSIRTARGLEV